VLGYGGCIAGIGGALAVARGYWASSTRKARERIGMLIEAIGETLVGPDHRVGDDTASPARDAIGDAGLTGA
jgi:hypothetical protein